jgi:hypothetical protein
LRRHRSIRDGAHGSCHIGSTLSDEIVMKLQRLRAEIKRWGWVRVLFRRLMWLLGKYPGLHIYRVNKRPLDGHAGTPDLPDGITLAIVPPGKLLDAAADPALEMEPDFVRAALARGDLAFGAFDGDRLIAYVWRTFTAAPHEEDLWVRVDPPCHYAYNAFTLPPYRGKRIHIALSLLCDKYFIELGYTAEVGFSEISNYPSIAAGEFLGRRRVGFAGYVKCFGRYISFRTPGVKKLGFEFFEPPRHPGSTIPPDRQPDRR